MVFAHTFPLSQMRSLRYGAQSAFDTGIYEPFVPLFLEVYSLVDVLLYIMYDNVEA